MTRLCDVYRTFTFGEWGVAIFPEPDLYVTNVIVPSLAKRGGNVKHCYAGDILNVHGEHMDVYLYTVAVETLRAGVTRALQAYIQNPMKIEFDEYLTRMGF